MAHVEPGTPAAAAGIEVGDVIVNVRGRAIGRALDVLTTLAEVANGQTVAVEVVRDQRPVTLQAVITNESARHATDPTWSNLPQWLRDMMKPFAMPGESASPLRGSTR